LTGELEFDPTGETRKIYINHGPADPNSPNANNDGLREKLLILKDAINKYASLNPYSFFWKADLSGYRLTVLPTKGDENKVVVSLQTGPSNINTSFLCNVYQYMLGPMGSTIYQFQGKKGTNGTTPTITEFEKAFEKIDKQVDIFNLLVLPKDSDPKLLPSQIWGAASVFCKKRRAFLLMDAPGWKTVQAAMVGIVPLRIGLVKDYSAIFYPALKISDNGLEKVVGPSGAIAGVMARTDSTRGVWKAPAGTEAFLTGVTGLTEMLNDAENGNLNPRAINALRVFPNGIVNWGARTMDGDDDFQSEYKYIPVRRLALYMEESLYRGLKWVVFEPNDEPLWSQIRLNVGAFMHDLFTQGAFQGITPKDAYFVKCDKETTTQNDINKGVVNIWVGFAPLKPAEFVILHIQQMAGQINQ
jgi:hypothetical protein